MIFFIDSSKFGTYRDTKPIHRPASYAIFHRFIRCQIIPDHYPVTTEALPADSAAHEIMVETLAVEKYSDNLNSILKDFRMLS
jgi:hypothetical protein